MLLKLTSRIQPPLRWCACYHNRLKTLNARVYDAAVETPLNKAHALSSLTNNNVYFKREDMQPVFSFKIRGAYNRIVSAHPVPAQCRGTSV